jgi:hypothetical protein
VPGSAYAVEFAYGARGTVTLTFNPEPGMPVTIMGGMTKLGASVATMAVVSGYSGLSDAAMGEMVPTETGAPDAVPGSMVGATYVELG